MTGHEQNLISTLFRWVLDPQQSTTLRIRFSSERLAVVDQTLSFELLGTKKNYQIFYLTSYKTYHIFSFLIVILLYNTDDIWTW